MSREALHESLSAVMDNEADELELRRVLTASSDTEMRATWLRYQVARAAMHKELIEPRLDIASAVSAALADEAAPAPAPVQRRFAWRGVGRMAVAASVTVAVLAGVRLYNQESAVTPQLAGQATQPVLGTPSQPAAAIQGPAVLAGYSDRQDEASAPVTVEPASASWQEQRLPEYIRQHAQQAAFGTSGEQVEPPRTRAAGMEGR